MIDAIDGREVGFVAERGELYPQVPEILGTLRSSVNQMAICTNGGQEYVESVIATFGLAGFFDAVRYRRADQDTKPVMVHELLEDLGSRPAIMIGDRREDTDAAHQNRLKAIAAIYGYGAEEESATSDAAADSPAELPRLVRLLLMTGSTTKEANHPAAGFD